MKAAREVEHEGDIFSNVIQTLFCHPDIDVNKYVEGRTALHWAVKLHVKSEIGVKLLLSHNDCDVNAVRYKPRDNAHRTALMLAVIRTEKYNDRFWKISKLLLNDRRIDINKKVDGWTALHWATTWNAKSHLGVEVLLSHEFCDVNSICTSALRSNTALMLLLPKINSRDDKYLKMLRSLLHHPQVDLNIPVSGRSAIHVAVNECPSERSLQILLESLNCDVNAVTKDLKPNKTALMIAVSRLARSSSIKIRKKRIKFIEIILRHDLLDINQCVDGFTALHWAIRGSDASQEAVQLLIENPLTDVNAICSGVEPPKSVLMILIQNETVESSAILSILVKNKALDVNQSVEGMRAIRVACDSHISNGLKILLSREDCNCNAVSIEQDGSAYTPLMYLLRIMSTKSYRSSRATSEMIEILLNQKSLDVNKQLHGMCALHVAHQSDYLVPSEITDQLLAVSSLDINVCDQTTEPPLTLLEKAVCYEAYLPNYKWSNILHKILNRQDLLIRGDFLHNIVKHGFVFTAQLESLLCDERVDVNAVDETLDPPQTVLMHIIAKPADIAVDDEICRACWKMFKLLTQNPRLSINKMMESTFALQWAISIGAFSSASKIFISPEKTDKTPSAIKYIEVFFRMREGCETDEDIVCIRELLATEGVDINKTSFGVAAIHHVVSENNDLSQKVFDEFSRQKSFNPNVQDRDGNTPLHLCIKIENEKLANSLLADYRADVNIQNKKGNTPLMMVFNVFPNYSPDYFRWIAMFLRHPRINLGLKTKHDQLTVGDLLILRDNQERPQFNRSRLAAIIEGFSKENTKFQWGEHTLATAIHYSSTRLCKIMLKTGANCNSYIKVNQDLSHDHHLFKDCHIATREYAIHGAILENSLPKVKLLVENMADMTVKWKGFMPLQLAMAYNVSTEIIKCLLKNETDREGTLSRAVYEFGVAGETLNDFSMRSSLDLITIKNTANVKFIHRTIYMKPDCKLRNIGENEHETDSLKWVNECRKGFKKSDGVSKEVLKNIEAFIENVRVQLYLIFKEVTQFVLCGSMSEGTKVYLPNEFDYLCVRVQTSDSAWRNAVKTFQQKLTNGTPHENYDDIHPKRVSDMADEFYNRLDIVLSEVTVNHSRSDCILCYKKALIRGRKVSRIQVLWNQSDQMMPIHIDVIPASKVNYIFSYPVPCENFYAIAKVSRYARHKRTLDDFTLSYSEVEKEFLRAVPLVVKHGYILAKAVRITCIAKPDEDLRETFALDEDIEIDELVSSHMLKTCLIREFADRKEQDFTAVDVAIKVYEHFHSELKSGVLTSWCNDEIKLYDCSACLNARAKFPTTDQPLQVCMYSCVQNLLHIFHLHAYGMNFARDRILYK